MLKAGFLGTQAPLFMDLATLIVALIPIALYGGIILARKRFYNLHRLYQWLVFILTIIVLGWFEYGVRIGGGFSSLSSQSSLPKWLLVSLLVVHIAVASITLLWWLRTLLLAQRNWRSRNLPGGYSLRHIKSAWWSVWGVFLTALSGIWIYLLLFIF